MHKQIFSQCFVLSVLLKDSNCDFECFVEAKRSFSINHLTVSKNNVSHDLIEQNGSQKESKSLRGRSWRVLGAPKSLLGESWKVRGSSSENTIGILEAPSRSWGRIEGSGQILRSVFREYREHLGSPQPFLGRSWRVSGTLGRVFRGTRECLGRVLGASGKPKVTLRRSFGGPVTLIA